MSRKAIKQGPTGSKKGGEDDREDSLQAIVLADSFETRFNPFVTEQPRCLLPLANTPMIEYTLEFLANAGVEDIFVYCGAHTEQVEDYIRNSKWHRPSSPFKNLEMIKSTSRSIGDAMRDLDSRHIITGDFLIVSGDVVSNLPLEPALARHRARRAVDKDAIMTMVLREGGLKHRDRARGAEPVFVIDPINDRCLHYEEMHPLQSNKYVNLDPDFFSSHSEIDVRTDLVDCYIDICAPDVLALWTDSFDYESPRKHFLYGVLKDYELNGKKIHTHMVRDCYAARVRNLQAYDAISKDIVSRWAYPLCPDSNLLQGQSYRLERGNIYLEDGVVLARSSVIGRRTVIGQGTSIGDGTIVTNSIIGRRCQIGRNVRIDGAYIWDDAVVSNHSQVRQAIIANEAVVGANCTIEPGALISFGVRLGNGTRVKGSSRIATNPSETLTPNKQASSKTIQTNNALVGKDGYGHEFNDSDEDEKDIDRLSSLVYNLPDLAVSDSSISTLRSDGESEEPVYHRERASTGSFSTSVSSEGRDDDFHNDASTSIFDALQREDGPDIVQIELQGLRMGVDADYHEVRRAVITAFLRRIQQLTESRGLTVAEAVSQVIRTYHNVFAKTIFDKEKEAKIDQLDFLLLLQKDLVHRAKGETVLLFMAKELYDVEVLEEEGFNQWWQDERSKADEDMRRVRAQTQQFVEWLADAEEDSDDDDDDDSDNEEG